MRSFIIFCTSSNINMVFYITDNDWAGAIEHSRKLNCAKKILVRNLQTKMASRASRLTNFCGICCNLVPISSTFSPVITRLF